MSRSHSSSSRHSRDRRSREDRTLAVTEASFQGLQLGETVGASHLTVPSSYHSSSHTSRRPSPRADLSAGYVQTGYDPTYSPRPATYGNFPGSQHTGSAFEPDPSTLFVNPDPFDMGSTYPSYPAAEPFTPGTRDATYPRSPAMRDYPPYSGPENPRRSMSGPSGLSVLPSSTFGVLGTEEREVARQRRRNLQESRRHAKIRVRRTRLPSIPDARSGGARTLGPSIDYLAAPSTASYGSHSPYSLSSSSSMYDNSYQSSYGDISHPYPPSSYMQSQGSTYPTSSSNPPLISSRPRQPVGSTPEEPIRVIERKEKPQCWEHGCNGRQFSTFSNLLRHQREKSGTATKSYCPRCGAEFTRTTARNGHMAHDKCKARSPRGSSG